MIHWKKIEDKLPPADTKVWLTNGRNITLGSYNAKLKQWSYMTVLMYDATHWCSKKDFECVFPGVTNE